MQPPGPAHEPVHQFLRATSAARSLAQCSEFLGNLDVPWSPVKTLHEAVTSELAAARGMRVEQPAGQPHIGIPIKFRQEPGRLDGRRDALGESTAAVLREAGYADHALAQLRRLGALG